MALPVVLLVGASALGRAQALNPCDLVAPFGTVDVADVQAAIDMTMLKIPCTANIAGAGVCTVAVVQRVINAALGGPCVSGLTAGIHYASLNWTASASSNVTGYNVYRATTSGGPYTKVNTSLVGGTAFTDAVVSSGQTYYYVITAVDNGGNESTYSNQASASIPN